MKRKVMSGLLVVIMIGVLVGCASNEDKAREKLIEMGLSFTTDDFIQSISSNNSKATQLFLDAGMLPDVLDSDGNMTPLMAATQRENMELLDVLLKNTEDINLTNDNGMTALEFAVNMNQTEVVQRLLDAGADSNLDSEYQLPLIKAASNENLEIIKMLLDNGADPNKVKDNQTALSVALKKRNSKLVTMLLAAKADPNIKVNDQNSLIYALKADQPDNAIELINHGVEIPSLILPEGRVKLFDDPAGGSLLTYAKLESYIDVAEILIKNGIKDASLLTFATAEKTAGINPVDNPLYTNELILVATPENKNPSITYDLGGEASKFTANYINSGSETFPYTAKFVVKGDGKILFEKSLGVDSSVNQISLDVSNIKHLTINFSADKFFHFNDSDGTVGNPIITYK